MPSEKLSPFDLRDRKYGISAARLKKGTHPVASKEVKTKSDKQDK